MNQQANWTAKKIKMDRMDEDFNYAIQELQFVLEDLQQLQEDLHQEVYGDEEHKQ